MGKYQSFTRRDREPQVRKKEVHPIWRGLGCIFMVVVPIFSYFVSDWVIETNRVAHWFQVPNDFILQYKGWDPLLLTKLLMTLAFIFIFAVIFMFVTYATNSMFGGSRYGPLDVPPEPYRRRKR